MSIIIPVYNAEKYLSETIESVINQSYTNWELIAVNDGSKDNSLNILNNYAENEDRIKVYTIQNSGASYTRSFGFNKSKGEYIKFLDSDDIISSNHLELQYNTIKNNPNFLSTCEWSRFYNGNLNNVVFKYDLTWKNFNSLDFIKASLSLGSDMMSSWIWLIPRSIYLKSGGWNPKLSLNDDFDFSIRLLLAAEGVRFAKGAKFYYRSGLSTSLSQTFSQKAVESAFLTTELGCDNILKTENTKETRLLCANRYQTWVYRIYPNFPNIVKKFENKVTELGGSSISIEGGRFLLLLTKLFGWKKPI